MCPPTEMFEIANVKIEVQHDQPGDLAAGRDVAAPLEHEQRAEDPEDRARRADGDASRGSGPSAPAEPAMPEPR